MRNLTILNRGHIVPESRTYPDLNLINSVFDPVSDSLTFVLSNEESGLVEVQQFMKSGEVKLLASFPKNDPFDNLLSVNHFADSCQLIFVFGSGDIVTASYDPVQPDPDATLVEIVGSIDSGLKSACWSPDEETLSILTNENSLLLLSRSFEPISEKQLNPDDLSTSKHVSVGWGKKETQFKGRGMRAIERERDALKHAGLDIEHETELRDPTLGKIEKGTLSEYDDHKAYISWRGDCEYFSVSTVESVDGEYERRVIRVFTREGELDSISEAVDGLENNLSWKPQGALIASTQRHIGEEIGEEVLDLVFFERNGLRHGEFNTRLPPTERILNVEWSSNSEVLALQLSNSVLLWTSKNYHWYLKQEIFSRFDEQISFIKFHPEKPLTLMLGTVKHGVEIIDLAYTINAGPSIVGEDVGMSVVIDGTTAMVTPLSIANVPPPVSFREFEVSENIIDVAVSKSNELYATLTKNEIVVSSVELSAMRKGKHPQTLFTINKDSYATNIETARQISFIQNNYISVVLDSDSFSKIVLIDLQTEVEPVVKETFDIIPKIVLSKLQADFNALTFETIDGKLHQLSGDGIISEICQFPQLCREYEVAIVPGASEWDDQVKLVAFGISANGKLYANEEQISSAVTSLMVTESLLLFTTAQGQLRFMHLNSTTYKEAEENEEEADERIRTIERGSLLVSVMPSKASVVLQAPRGNLETICPRIMVLAGVRSLIKERKYKEAFLQCRTHRIHLDILHDYDPETFFNSLDHFVKEIEKIEYLDLFVSCLHEEDVCLTKYKETATLEESFVPQLQGLNISAQQKKKDKDPKDSKINKICEGILSVLSKPEYSKKYLQTIITAYACESPPNLDAALRLISSLTDSDESEKAVTHLCFLQDVNKLYNTALGLYDVKLTLNIAQKSQKDPKEYLPFLQNLHTQEPLRRQFLIDTFLKNFEKALHSLAEIGEVVYSEFDDYVVEHSLYNVALGIYRYDNVRSNAILNLYAEALYQSQDYEEAALTFETLGLFEQALESYILGKRWREALTIVQKEEFKDKLEDTAERLISSLTDDHKYSAAAEIEFTYLGNIEAALKLYSKDYYYEKAILLASKEHKTDLIETIIDPALGEGFGTVAELLADCKSQLNSQLRRIRELREKKLENPYEFYGTPDDLDTPDNVSVAASETSTTPSFFTRYTGKTAGTAKTGVSRKSSKNRRREERKKAKGRKGTIYEEEYLINSVGRLIERMDKTSPEAVRLIEGLTRRGMKEQAYQVQKNFVDLVNFLRENIVEIHSMSERDRERIDDNGEVYYIPEIPVPTIKDFPKKKTLDF